MWPAARIPSPPAARSITDYSITYAPGSFVVIPAPLTISADNQSKVYGAAMPTLTASYTGFVNGDTTASLTKPTGTGCSADATSHVSGSPYSITVSGAVDSDYNISYVAGTLTVTPAPLTIAANQSEQSLRSGAAHFDGELHWTGERRHFATFNNSPNTPPSLATTATAASHVAGSPYTITVSGAIDTDYIDQLCRRNLDRHSRSV